MRERDSMRLEVVFLSENDTQTISKWAVFNEVNIKLAEGYMLELSDKNNQNSISRVNEGEYDAVKRNSAKYGDHFHILNVEGRKWILIHVGNYFTNTRGCLLPGLGLKDINKDGFKDVTSSGSAMKLLNKILPNKFKVIINR